MKTETIGVSYRDKTTNQNVKLGDIEVPRFETVEEAVEYFNQQEDGKGIELVLDYVHTAYDIKQQAEFRAANRPDREKSQSLGAKFKKLTPEQQLAALKAAGIEL
jgi:hypothetical protein